MKRLLSFSAFCFAMAIAPLAQSQVVVPISFADVEGSSGGDNTALGNLSNTGQIVYNASVLSEAGLNSGDVLTGLSFRLNAVDNVPIWSVADYQIRLGTSVNSAGSLDPDFTLNRGADYTLVRSGPLSYDGTEYDSSSTAPSQGPGAPNAFGEVLTFNQSTFTYIGGDLLLEYTHSVIDNSLNSPGVQQTARGDAVFDFAGVQSQFSAGFDTTMEAFDGFGNEFAPVIQFTVAGCDPNSAGDATGDGVIQFDDFLILSANFGLEVDDHTGGDFNCDGVVQFDDFLTLSANFGQTVGVESVPEPSGILLVGLASLAGGLLRRRRN